MHIFDRPDDQRDQNLDEGKSGSLPKCEGAVYIPSAGDRCPTCSQGVLDYDGMLNLTCQSCGAVVNTGGAFT